MVKAPTLLDDLQRACSETGLVFRYRKAGSIKPLKPCNGQCIFRVTCGGSVVIAGLNAVADWGEVFADEVFRVSTGGWSYYR